MDLAPTDYVREIMIVSAPEAYFKVPEAEYEKYTGLEVHGKEATIRPVYGLAETDFYDFYEHA